MLKYYKKEKVKKKNRNEENFECLFMELKFRLAIIKRNESKQIEKNKGQNRFCLT